jgi:hypothetical protein
MNKLKRHPGYPVLFQGPYGDIRHGVTDGMEGECYRIIEIFSDDEESDYVWVVPPDYVTFDPEYDGDLPETMLDNLSMAVLALPLLVAGCIAAWAGLFMFVLDWNPLGLLGFVLLGICFYWAAILVEKNGGE